jgi:hypothetical protein
VNRLQEEDVKQFISVAIPPPKKQYENEGKDTFPRIAAQRKRTIGKETLTARESGLTACQGYHERAKIFFVRTASTRVVRCIMFSKKFLRKDNPQRGVIWYRRCYSAKNLFKEKLMKALLLLCIF